MAEEFDWSKLGNRSSKYIDWLKSVYQTPMTEAEFAEGWHKLYPTRTTESRPRKEYKFMKKQFGFFGDSNADATNSTV